MTTTNKTRELATILAALRCYQQHLNRNGNVPHPDFYAIATDERSFMPMEDHEIDGLCEDLNHADTSKMLELVAATNALLHDVESIKGYWTEGMDNSVQWVRLALKGKPKPSAPTVSHVLLGRDVRDGIADLRLAARSDTLDHVRVCRDVARHLSAALKKWGPK